jgi:fumarylacetoacetase
MTASNTTLDQTHSEFAKSWVLSANQPGCDFPIQNLPFSVCRRTGSQEAFRGCVAIGDQVIDLAQVAQSGCLDGLAGTAASACAQPALNDFFALGPAAWKALRHGLFELLEKAFYGAKVDALRQGIGHLLQAGSLFFAPALALQQHGLTQLLQLLREAVQLPFLQTRALGDC